MRAPDRAAVVNFAAAAAAVGPNCQLVEPRRPRIYSVYIAATASCLMSGGARGGLVVGVTRRVRFMHERH